MKKFVQRSLIVLCFFLLGRDSYASPPVFLWGREIDVGHAEMAKNGSIIVGYGYAHTTPRHYFALNPADGEILWEYDAAEVINWIRISDDGNVISVSGEIPCPPEDPMCWESEYDDWRDFQTYIRRPDGTLITQMDGGATLLSPDGDYIYIHGIPIIHDPKNGIFRYKHGLFTTTGVERCSHIIEPIPMIQNSEYIAISNSGTTILRECGFKINGTDPSECTPWGGGSRWLIDGATGNTLFLKKSGSSFATLSWDGSYVLTWNSSRRDGPGKRLLAYNRQGELVLDKAFGETEYPVYANMSRDNTRIAVATTQNLHWLNLAGNIIWSIPMTDLSEGSTGMTPGYAIQISDDNRAIRVLRFRHPGPPETWQFGMSLVHAETGQVVADFLPGYDYGVMSGDHTRLMLVRMGNPGSIELYDISPLFQ
jgi:hypothetical protein